MALGLAAGQPQILNAQDSVLQPGRPLARDLRPGESHSYSTGLTPGQFTRIILRAPAGSLTISFAGPEGPLPAAVWSGSISWVARTSGPHRLTLESRSAVHYEVELAELRAATDTDSARVSAQIQFETGLESERAGDTQAAVKSFNASALAWRKVGDEENALDIYRRELAIHRAAQNARAEADTLADMCNVYFVLGEQQKVLDTYKQVHAIRRQTHDLHGEILALTNLGNLYRDLGAEDTALDYYRQAIAAGLAAGNSGETADAWMGMGDVYFYLGEKKQSIEAYERSLALKRAAKDRSGEALNLIGLANIYSNLAFRQKPEDDEGEAGKRKGLEAYEKSLAIGRSSSDYIVQVFALMGAGVVYSSLGEKQKAIDYFNQALFIFGLARYRQGIGWTRYEMARVERDRGNLGKALSYVTEARGIVESLRATVVSQDLRASFFAAVRDCYSLEIDILMRQYVAEAAGSPNAESILAAALTASEHAHARVLLEALGESRAEIREGVDPALLERERKLQTELNAKETARLRLIASPSTPALSREMEKAVKDLAAQYEELSTQIRERSPHYAALKFPKPLTLSEIQQQVLDGDTLLLEYALGEEGSYAWLVSNRDVVPSVLPKRKVVEDAARRFHDALASGSADRAEAGAELGRMVLGGLARDLGNKRLLIVADGALQYVPFASLPDPSSGGPLIARHEIVNVPSASTLAVLRREFAGRPAAPKAVAILADPVFSRDDTRFNRSAAPAGKRAPVPDATSGLRLARLPGTRREAAGIAALIPESNRKQALDFDASRATLSSPEIGQYRILHLATHGLLNTEHPELSGVALSLIDRNGKPQDGFIRLHEVYNMKLSTDLVVLSACQTALGKDIQGEGLVGLARGFMYAGAPRVLASLWKVDDRATAELMKLFYAAMLGPQALPPAAALRSAQLALSARKGFEDPAFWAAFTLQGEFR